MDTEPNIASHTLLARIMRRFGLERQLMRIRRNFDISMVFLFLAGAGTLVAAQVLRALLQQSAFLPYAMLIRSDFHPVIEHWQSFISAVFESAPTAFITIVLLGTAFLLSCVRLALVLWQRMSQVSTSIRNN